MKLLDNLFDWILARLSERITAGYVDPDLKLNELHARDMRNSLARLVSDDDRRAVAIRTALRGFDGIREIDSAPWSLSAEIGAALKLQALRVVFVGWCELTFDGVRSDARREAFAALPLLLDKLDQALPDFYAQNVMGSDYACSACQELVEAGRRSAALVEATDHLAYRTSLFDTGRTYVDLLDTTTHFGSEGWRENQRAWRAFQQAAFDADCELLLSRRLSVKQLMLQQLWPGDAAAAFAANLSGWGTGLGDQIEFWLRERQAGGLVMDENPDSAKNRMIGIANLPQSFWIGEPPLVVLEALDHAMSGAGR